MNKLLSDKKNLNGSTLLIGATGKIGQHVTSMLSKTDHSLIAMVRQHSNTFNQRVIQRKGDLEHNIESAMTGCKQVIFSAGSGADSGFDKTLLIDLWGARKVIDAAKKFNIEHFIMISSRGADNPDNGPQAIKPYLVAKHFADEYLLQSGLPYTILRPGRLTDEIGTGCVNSVRSDNPADDIIAREDVAKTIIHCLYKTAPHQSIVELYQGHKSIENIFS
jgi:nucleoside-diphosphate-sugar epimerase